MRYGGEDGGPVIHWKSKGDSALFVKPSVSGIKSNALLLNYLGKTHFLPLAFLMVASEQGLETA